MEKCRQQLPPEYKETLRLDLQSDGKQVLWVNGLATGIALVMFAAGWLLSRSFLHFENLLTLAAFLACVVLYMVLHELTHGLCMKVFGARRVKYGFTGLYAFAGSDEYFQKGAYIVVALAPLVVWSLVLLGLNWQGGAASFWFFYLLQLVNVSGAAGDLYVTARLLRLPGETLVQDTGVSMKVFTRG